MYRLVALATVLAAVSTAHADDSVTPGEKRAPLDLALKDDDKPKRAPLEVSTLRRIAAVAAAIVPGFVVHGAGAFVLGERRTGKRLAAVGALGLGAAALGGLAVGLSGSSPYTIWPGVPAIVLGSGLLFPSWFADIWLAAGGDRVHGVPRSSPTWSLELGMTWLHEAYRERGLARFATRLELGRLGLGAGAMVDSEGDGHTGEVEVRWRLRGPPATNAPISDGSRLYLRAATRYNRDNPDDVSQLTFETEIVGRLDLQYLDVLLDATFLELSTGLGMEGVTYANAVHDWGSLLLGRFAWGMYLGSRGEASLFYDHRRDSMAGGLPAWRAAGFFGSVGASTTAVITGPWALRAELEIGNAWVTTIALRYQGGP
ncbi:MAG: hypothetical protein H0T79_14075 [Deltaproteobacteria bacterium]|nr:hypothetical protein [Deltaproteobacteria bacterium]